eukprot:CAMPEP_0168621468 /NCGR_PEP_ID=MMETSP0449_2-20121227/7706_1 /TAXON_ID=1082188 /ORGANISM="Strombidium rassoulzadegani, Strain ras09" /LENGTH=66 /DNA_ID=CAMNT_0008662581 /DNA_START=328 /DNA_END=528 /DNA_ORIENTATION=-
MTYYLYDENNQTSIYNYTEEDAIFNASLNITEIYYDYVEDNELFQIFEDDMWVGGTTNLTSTRQLN